MLLPVRCYTCNARLDGVHSRIANRRPTRAELDAGGVRRMCCRTLLLTHVELAHDMCRHGAVDACLDDVGTVMRRKVHLSRRVRCDDGSHEPVVREHVVREGA
jgi:DNA-directed RNA polymerase subunit N (RpoN/RPB10)